MELSRIAVPSFDLAWLECEEDVYVLIPGGGGSTKSGVKNQIQIAKVSKGGTAFEFIESFKTDTDDKTSLCSGIYCGTFQKQAVVCALLDSFCRVLSVEHNAVDGTITLVKKAEFVADKAAEEPSVNCCCITRENVVVTGGEDGTCRLWTLSKGKSSKDEWKAVPAGDLTGHTSPIMALSLHPTNPWVCSASKDGTCKVWNISTKSLLLDIPHIDGLAGVGSNKLGKKPTMECRGCCFSEDGEHLYTIQSARSGSTHLIKWVWEDEQKGTNEKGANGKGTNGKGTNKKSTMIAKPIKYIAAAKIPSTRLKINDSGTLLALGTCEGSTEVFDTRTLSKVKKFTCHALPVTGLGFCPSKIPLTAGKRALLVSCSADRIMAKMPINEPMSLLTMLLVLLAILLLMVMAGNLHLVYAMLS